MKLYVTAYPKQAQNALGDFRGQKVSYITNTNVFKGTLRQSKSTGVFHVIRNGEKTPIVISSIVLIVNDENETRILTNL